MDPYRHREWGHMRHGMLKLALVAFWRHLSETGRLQANLAVLHETGGAIDPAIDLLLSR
jgi:hypothetical protein